MDCSLSLRSRASESSLSLRDDGRDEEREGGTAKRVHLGVQKMSHMSEVLRGFELFDDGPVIVSLLTSSEKPSLPALIDQFTRVAVTFPRLVCRAVLHKDKFYWVPCPSFRMADNIFQVTLDTSGVSPEEAVRLFITPRLNDFAFPPELPPWQVGLISFSGHPDTFTIMLHVSHALGDGSDLFDAFYADKMDNSTGASTTTTSSTNSTPQPSPMGKDLPDTPSLSTCPSSTSLTQGQGRAATRGLVSSAITAVLSLWRAAFLLVVRPFTWLVPRCVWRWVAGGRRAGQLVATGVSSLGKFLKAILLGDRRTRLWTFRRGPRNDGTHQRTFHVREYCFPKVKRASKVLGVTVNDVLATAAGGGLSRYLHSVDDKAMKQRFGAISGVSMFNLRTKQLQQQQNQPGPSGKRDPPPAASSPSPSASTSTSHMSFAPLPQSPPNLPDGLRAPTIAATVDDSSPRAFSEVASFHHSRTMASPPRSVRSDALSDTGTDIEIGCVRRTMSRGFSDASTALSSPIAAAHTTKLGAFAKGDGSDRGCKGGVGGGLADSRLQVPEADGNSLSFIVVPFETDLNLSSRTRLMRTKRTMDGIKASAEPYLVTVIARILRAVLTLPAFSKLVPWLMARASFMFSSLKGPAQPIRFAGVEILSVCNFFRPMRSGLSMSFLTYVDKLAIAVCADTRAIKEPKVLIDGVVEELELLTSAAVSQTP
ncbi:unnamed protein product [Vitrella brassicaformis CCMP3155]|uniref:O-acyltransferase WSD1 C-terminal domain-containing protein n=1 Tax=Vitrella brassicaformis (strain CCMP3155) TaxID=1169540 RepID=A0A0G4G330_VITBC|nr:unnamed protein product [Vitrella brassicaformis CCMP3155]|eukprot:CEM22139.1 unnamed protein product [Vitrella brassicaformis CCMP3155]